MQVEMTGEFKKIFKEEIGRLNWIYKLNWISTPSIFQWNEKTQPILFNEATD